MLLAIIGWALLVLALVAAGIVANLFWSDIMELAQDFRFSGYRYKGRHRDEPPWVWCR